MKKLISVIIPVYNSEKYLDDCIQSLLNSNHSDQFEMILIDDGSTDASGSIADSYSDKYQNIRSYHYKNAGVSASRNRGIKIATCDYLFFIDSDDQVAPNFIWSLYEKADRNDCELTIAGFTTVSEDLKDESIYHRSYLKQDNVLSGLEMIDKRIEANESHNETWGILYKRKFLIEHGLFFDEDMKIYEDVYLLNRMFLHATKVATIPDYGYFYRKRENSLVSGGPQIKDIEAAILVADRMTEYASDLNEEQSRRWGRVLFQVISMTLYYIGLVNPSDKHLYYKTLQNREILSLLKKGICSKKEYIKYLIFKYCIWLFYPMVKKR